jgi:myo-inositol 2-dehydrogenase/D-chiro-inositol 1-dehydrogenase
LPLATTSWRWRAFAPRSRDLPKSKATLSSFFWTILTGGFVATNKTVAVGLIGAGRIGKVHARSIAANASSRLVAVADAVSEAAQALASEIGASAMSVDDVLADSSIDAVLIASSTNTHADLIEASISAGKAVLCEKPIDLDLQRALACSASVRKSGRPVMMGFNRRFDPNFAALKAAFDAGEIGKGELLTLSSFDPAPPPVSYIKVSGGLYRDMMIHDFDMACWIFGGVPERVTATGSCLVDPAIGDAGDIDTAVVVLHFSEGRLATIKNSRRAVYGYDQRLELLGSTGLLSADNVLENTVVKSTANGVISAKPEFFFLQRYMRAYEAEWSQFVESLIEGGDLPTTVQDGVNALAVAEAANRSYQSRETVALTANMLGEVA